jgi:predicted dithiol-disulfide oxidoreductase (DUF899 family)
MAGDRRLGDVEVAADLGDGRRTAAESLDDVAAERVGEGFERIVSYFANYIGGAERDDRKGMRMTEHRTGPPEEWLAARRELLDAEKEHMRRGDELARRRRELPWVPIEKEYVFEADDGQKTLTELFDGRSQLLVYHFMFGFGNRVDEQNPGCTGCSFVADHFDAAIPHLNAREVTLVSESIAPLDQLRPYKERMGWRFPWVSSLSSDFKYDFGAAFTEEQQRNGADYNFRHLDQPPPQLPGMSNFALVDGVVHHTYSTYGRGVEQFMGTFGYFDVAPLGRNEEGAVGEWWRRHDEYGTEAVR